MRGKDAWADEVLIFCKRCPCHRGTRAAWRERETWGRKGEAEWLISDRNKILRKHACCQPELALPYCLAFPAHVPNDPPFIHRPCASATHWWRGTDSGFHCGFLYVSPRPPNVTSGHLWCLCQHPTTHMPPPHRSYTVFLGRDWLILI